ncbi:hypothetical protein SDC9_30425 [bioreactor metagenome]|uniref:Uncharacterized protein n=1 Tax=bioreactor metagenome TaxID=1076179 RepID=A0A644UZG2_9ZZZZ
MPAAQADIGLVAADLHLCALAQRAPVGPHAHHHRRLLAAMADRAYLAHLVGKGEEGGRAGEEFAAEVDAQPVAHHRHREIIDHTGQLPDLVPGQELRLVDEDAGAGGTGHPRRDQRCHVGLGGEGLGLGADADAACDPALARAPVEPGGDEEGLHAALDVVVGRLQQQRALAGIHRRVMEVELGHAAP